MYFIFQLCTSVWNKHEWMDGQATPLTASDKCHNLPRSGGNVLITPSRRQRSQNAKKPGIGSESRFLPTPPAFNAPVRDSRQNIAMTFGVEKLEWRGYPMVKKLRRCVYSFCQHSIARQNYTSNAYDQCHDEWHTARRFVIS